MYTANRTWVINANWCLECIFTPTGNKIYVLEQLMVHLFEIFKQLLSNSCRDAANLNMKGVIFFFTHPV